MGISHLTDQLKSLFIGDDIFISYARGDATGYALALANSLGEHGFVCYLDQYGTGPNDEVDKQVLSKLRISRVFVLVGSRLAIDSKPIEYEVNCFKATGRAIIPIDVDRAFRDTRLYRVIRGLPLADDLQVLNETTENLHNDSPQPAIVNQINGTIENLRKPGPSSRIIDRIVSTLSYTKRTQLQRAMLWAGSTFLLLSVGIALFAFVSAGRAERRRAAADSAAQTAQTKLSDANAKRLEVEDKLSKETDLAQRQSTINGALQQIEQSARLRNERPSEALALTAAAFRAAPDTIQSVSALAGTLQYYRHLRSLMLTDTTDPIVTLASALNGRVIAFGSSNQLRDARWSDVIFYDTQAQRRITVPKELKNATAITCTAVGSLCAGPGPSAWRLVSKNGRLEIEALELAKRPVDAGSYAVTNDERIIAYDSREQRFQIWNPSKPTEDPQQLACSADKPTAFAVSPDGKTLAFATTGLIPSEQHVLDIAAVQIHYCALEKADTQPRPTELPGRSVQYVTRIIYSNDGKFLAVDAGGVSLIETASRAVIAVVKDVDREFAFVPLRDASSGTPEIRDGNRAFQLLVTSDTRRLTAWEITKEPVGGERLFKHWQEEYAPGITRFAALNDAATTLLSGGAGGAIAFWDFNANPFLESASYTLPAPSRPRVSIRHASFLSDPDELIVVDAQNPHGVPKKIPISVPLIRSADIDENATLLALVRQTWADGTHGGVDLWDLRDFMKPQRMQPLYKSVDATCVAFARDGRLALGYDNGRVVIWNVNTRKPIQELASPVTVISPSLGRYPGVESIAFRPDGKRLASSSRYRPLNLWDVETGTLIWSLEESGADRSQNYEQELAFSPDGKKLLTSVQGVTKVWDVDPSSWAERALRLASRTPPPIVAPPVAPIAALDGAQGAGASDPRVGYWRYQSGGYYGSGTENPPPALYIQVIQGQLAVSQCDEYSDCLKVTPSLNFLVFPMSSSFSRSLTVLPDGRLEYKWVVRVAEGEASGLVYYTRSAP